MKIYEIVINNLSQTGMFCSQSIPRGTLGITVDKIPEAVYRKYGDTYISNSEGIVSCFTHVAGSTQGFAGRAMTLPVAGEGKVFKNKGITYKAFKGSLWYSDKARGVYSENFGESVHHIGIREKINKTGVFFSYYITDTLFQQITKHIVTGDPLELRDYKGCVNYEER